VKRRGLFSIFVATLLVAVLVLFLISFQVRRGESALVFTFGKVARALTQPGLYWKLPYPIQTVQRYDTRIRISDTKYDEVTTSDGRNLVVVATLGWSIQDPIRFYEKVRTPSVAGGYLTSLALGVQNVVFSNHPLSEFVSTEPGKMALDKIAQEIQDKVRKAAEEDYGVQMHFVRITHQGVPQPTTEKVFERMKAERDRVAKDLRSAGARQAEELRSRANKDRADILSQAEAEATEERGKGDAAALQYYAEFQKNPELAILLRKIDALRKLKEGTTLILDFRTPPYDLFQGILPSLQGLVPSIEKPVPKPKIEERPDKKPPAEPKPEGKGP
jgi:membrane protease subunit HflC